MFSIQLPSWLPRRSWLPHLAVHHPGVGTGTGRWDATAAHLTRRHVGKATFSRRNWGNQTSTNQPFWAKSSNMFMFFFYLNPPFWVDYAPSPKPQGRWEQPLMRFFLVVTSIRVRPRISVIVGTMQLAVLITRPKNGHQSNGISWTLKFEVGK